MEFNPDHIGITTALKAIRLVQMCCHPSAAHNCHHAKAGGKAGALHAGPTGGQLPSLLQTA